MRSRLSIEIAAPPDLVYGVVSDPRRWPAVLPHYVSVRPERSRSGAELARYVAIRRVIPIVGLGIPVAWRSELRVDPSLRSLRFRHVGGATGGMEASWSIGPAAAGTRVLLDHRFEPAVARLGVVVPRVYAGLIDHLFVRPIARRTLESVRAVSEALAGLAVTGGAAERASETERMAR